MADRDGGTGSVTVVVRLTMVVRASLTNFCQKHIAVLSARADPKRLSTGTSVFMQTRSPLGFFFLRNSEMIRESE